MMAEDCKSSSEDDGASRRKILDFLQNDARAQRKEILESGRYVQAEETFSTGFYDVLSTARPGFTETIQILGLLMTLSVVSGRNATRDTMGRFSKVLTQSTRSKKDVAQTQSLIRLWDEFSTKAENLDPRWAIYFLAEHGALVVELAIEKDDKVAKRILELINAHTSSRWRRYMENREDKDLEARQLIPLYAQTVLEAALVCSPLDSKYETRELIL
jgi:hypothetical protein